jgi:hypothetical protein
MRIHGSQKPLLDCVWHKYRPLIPVRTVEGTRRYSEIWRRWTGQFWEYSERPESRGEWTGEPRRRAWDGPANKEPRWEAGPKAEGREHT